MPDFLGMMKQAAQLQSKMQAMQDELGQIEVEGSSGGGLVKVRISGKGSPGRGGGPAGDLYVTVHVRSHRLFGRAGDDLTITVPITFAEAALGTTLRVPTLDGAVSLKIPAGTPSGRTLRVRGKGISRKGRTGDLLVTVDVAVPQHLPSDARAALEGFARTQTDDPRPQITAALAASAVRSGAHG